MKYKLKIQEKTLKGSVRLPSSKSISNRLLIIQALNPGKMDIVGLSDSDDTRVLRDGLMSTYETVDVGHAGTSMRFLTAYFAATGQAKILTGSDRMKERPIDELVDALNQLGADIRYLEKKGFPPIQTSGKPLSGNTVKISGSISSQFISALLLIAPVLPNGLTINITGDPVSSSYVKMTLNLMQQAGVEAQWKEQSISVAPQPYHLSYIECERDWSAASYWYEIASLANDFELFLEGVANTSIQGDAVVSQIFDALGVKTTYTEGGALLTKGPCTQTRFIFDFINAPDIAQTMAVCSCLKTIPFRFSGVKTLRIKETDRIMALQDELSKLGFFLEETKPGIIEWDGKYMIPQNDITISTYHDHRMAMAFAPAAIVFPGIQIEDPGVVTKSYPTFWPDLEKIGFKIEEID
ncbi:MAG: 3-phosphoshikimate 1-carboxyvinyltransferase [Bacteroidales bacterium]|jgi:3-phosphoshikimate 1-carboxyvinyltransferase|nr:3-phosphoshikimate 1-carboxyvinyltransferase [Bacteroidales bacterium]